MTDYIRLDGVYPVLPTPFDVRGEVMFEDIRREIIWEKQRDVDGVVVLGVASEVFRLSDTERARVIETAVDAAAGLPVIAGAGNLSTYLAVASARTAVASGASAVLVPPAPLGRASSSAIIEYYASVASAVDVPVILQDDPVHLGVGLSVPTIVTLRERHANCRYAKLEELPSMAKIRAVTEATRGQVSCLGGSGGVYLLEELAAGASGVMTGFAFPEALVAIYRAWRSGRYLDARRLNRIVSDLARLEALPGVSLAIRKRLYKERGAITTSELREPAMDVDEWTWELARNELALLEAEWAALTGRRPLSPADAA